MGESFIGDDETSKVEPLALPPNNATSVLGGANSTAIEYSPCSREGPDDEAVEEQPPFASTSSDLVTETSETDNYDSEGNLKLKNINPVSKRALSEKESRLFDVPKRLTEAHRY